METHRNIELPQLYCHAILNLIFDYTVCKPFRNRRKIGIRIVKIMNEFDKIIYNKCLRPYHVEYTSSRPITEVKQRRARLVLGWVTAWEYRVS